MKNISKIREKFRKASMPVFSFVIGTFLSLLAAPVNEVLANNPADFLKGGGKGMFDNLTDTVEKEGASLYSLIMAIAVIVLVIGVIMIALTLSGKNANKREEGKSQLVWYIIGAILVFGAFGVIGLASNIGGSLAP